MSGLSSVDASNLFRSAPDRMIDVGSGKVAYRRVGQGPDVLFVHGWPVSGATWRKLLPLLAPHMTCHVIDLVGAGDSQYDRSADISIERHIRSLRLIVDELSLTQFSVIGHDSGGLLARHAFAGDPRLRSMVLINTEQPQGITWRFRQFLLMSRLPGFLSILGWAIMRPVLRKNPMLLGGCFADLSLIEGEFEEFFLAPLNRDPLRLWGAGQLLDGFDTRLVAELGGLHAKIDVPVKLVWGTRDPFFPVEWAREMVKTFPDASIHEVEGARLFCHEERPDEIAAAILTTLLAPATNKRDAA